MRSSVLAALLLMVVPSAAVPATPKAKGAPARAHDGLFVIGVVGLQESAQADGSSLASFFSKQLNKKVEWTVFKDYDSAANALIAKRIDIGWFPPIEGWSARLGGAKLLVKLVRGGEPFYRSVFFVRADSPFKDLKDVSNARVAWVDPSSATGHIFALALLARKGLNKPKMFSEEKFVGNHDAVCRAVQEKTADIGATFSDEPASGAAPQVDGCKRALAADAGSLRILAVSDRVPSDVVGVRQNMDPALADKVKDSLLGLPGTEEGRKLLKDVFKADSTAEFERSDFDPVERALEDAATVDQKKP